MILYKKKKRKRKKIILRNGIGSFIQAGIDISHD